MSRLYVSDLDGTLLRSDQTLSDFSRRTLTDLIEDGMDFTIASARSLTSMQKVLGDLPIRLPVIAGNGSAICDYRSGEQLVLNHLHQDVLREVYELVAPRRLATHLSVFRGTDNYVYYEGVDNAGMEWFIRDRADAGDDRFCQTDDLTRYLDDKVISVGLIGREREIRSLAGQMGESFHDAVSLHLFENPYCRGWWWLTVHDRRATKEQGLLFLLENTHYSRDDLVVFGDELNDESMFKIAGRAVAMRNSVPIILEIADEVIGSNDEDSVARRLLEEARNGASSLSCGKRP